MKKLLGLLFIGFVLISFNSNAQQKKGDMETQINTTTPIFSVILEVKDDQGNDLGMLDIQVVDRKNQIVDVKFRRMSDQLKGNDPIRPKVKLIHYPEVDERTYRLAESMEELQMPVDNKKVLLTEYMILLEAMRVRYF